MVKVEQRLKINEEIVREHLATFSDLKPGERPESEPHSRLPRERRQTALAQAASDWEEGWKSTGENMVSGSIKKTHTTITRTTKTIQGSEMVDHELDIKSWEFP